MPCEREVIGPGRDAVDQFDWCMSFSESIRETVTDLINGHGPWSSGTFGVAFDITGETVSIAKVNCAKFQALFRELSAHTVAQFKRSETPRKCLLV